MSRGELEDVRDRATRLKTRYLTLYFASSTGPYCRAAVVVGKHGRSIVERNQLRRRLRELVRVNLMPRCVAADLIVYALPGAYDAEFSTLSLEIEELGTKLTPGTEG